MITGVLGGGKSLVAVSRIRQYLWEGRRVATNLDIFPEHLDLGDNNKSASIVRLPDKPRACDLEAIGLGHDEEKPDEKRNGILVLDELATWLNSRSWRDKERQATIDWLMHARKKRWDVYLLVQDASVIDAQLRQSLCDHYVKCVRMDRIKVLGIKPPRIHVAHIYYGHSASGLYVGKWVYRGTDLFEAYDTEQVFKMDEMYTETGEVIDMRAPYSYLPPWHTKGRYLEPPVPKRSLKEWGGLAFKWGILVPLFLVWALSYLVCLLVPPVRKHFRFQGV
jgi:hypothetical protein